MVRIGPLSAVQRQALEQVRRRAVGRVSQRAHMVLLSARDSTVEQIAEIFGVGEDVVRKWLHWYQREGPTGLDDRPRPGRPPCNNGLVHGSWTVGLLAAFLAARFRLTLSPASVRRYLHQAGWRWARPRLAPATHAPRGQRKEDPATHLKLALIAQAVASAATLLYLDECDLHLLPVIRACWMKGPRLRVPTPGQTAKRALFGALNGRTGQLHHLVRPRTRAAQFVEFLEALAAAYPTGEVILVPDNVITHDAKLVRAWLARPEHARFRFLWLPKYTAHEHNPIERVWGPMKDAVAANRLHGSIDRLVEEADRYFATATFNAPHPRPATPNIVADPAARAA